MTDVVGTPAGDENNGDPFIVPPNEHLTDVVPEEITLSELERWETAIEERMTELERDLTSVARRLSNLRDAQRRVLRAVAAALAAGANGGNGHNGDDEENNGG